MDKDLGLHVTIEAITAPTPAAMIGIVFKENGSINMDSGWIISQFSSAPLIIAPNVRFNIGAGVTIRSSDIEFSGENDVGLHSIVIIARAV